jgi:hypothetical protein
VRIWAGEPNWLRSLSTAGCYILWPRTRSSDGWICVSRPRSRLLILVVFALADVQAEEGADLTDVDHTRPSVVLLPSRPTAPIATSTLRRASRPAERPVVMPLISGLSMPPEPVTPPPRPYVRQGEKVMPTSEAGRPIAGSPRR